MQYDLDLASRCRYLNAMCEMLVKPSTLTSKPSKQQLIDSMQGMYGTDLSYVPYDELLGLFERNLAWDPETGHPIVEVEYFYFKDKPYPDISEKDRLAYIARKETATRPSVTQTPPTET